MTSRYKGHYIYNFYLLPYQFRKDIVDSILLDSGQEVIHGRIRNIDVSLVVYGEVRIRWDGVYYKHASQFPDSLTRALRKIYKGNKEISYYRKRGLEIIDNNWYELIVRKNGQEVMSEVVDCDLCDETAQSAKDMIVDMYDIYKNEKI